MLIKHKSNTTSTVLEPSIPFHTLVKLVDAKDITNEKIRTLNLPLEGNSLTLKLSSTNLNSQDKTLESMFTQINDPNDKSKQQLRKYCIYCHKSNYSISNCFRKQREDKEGKRKAFSRPKSLEKSL